MSQRLVSASGFAPSLPGQYRTARLNWQRNSDHWAWRHVRSLVVEKYSRFLWSVMTSMGEAVTARYAYQRPNGLSCFSFLSLSYQINLRQPRCPYASLFFHIMPHASRTPFISVQCMAMPFFPLFPFCHRHAVASCFTSLPFHGRA